MSVTPLGIFVPAYNEEKRLPVDEFEAFLSNAAFDKSLYKVIFINDGSTDKTLEVLQKLQSKFPDQVIVYDLKENAGKANAVRQGIFAFKDQFEFLGYLDADLATRIEEFFEIGKLALEGKKTMYFGCRIKKLGSKIERKKSRHIVGRICVSLAYQVIRVPIYDTQCGAKFFHKDLIAKAFEKPFLSRWLFDIELISRIISFKGESYFENNAVEVPLDLWLDKQGSKIKFKDFIILPMELLRIYLKYGPKARRKKQSSL